MKRREFVRTALTAGLASTAVSAGAAAFGAIGSRPRQPRLEQETAAHVL